MTKNSIVIKKLQLNKLQLKLQLVVTYCKNFFNIIIYNQLQLVKNFKINYNFIFNND